MKARIIIGANYGDEGKGTIVARYSKESDSVLNILTNGGAQRSHTIVTKDFGLTTFKHFGSGTYHGADTYYSRFFILNPIQFVEEYSKLIIKPKNIYRDPNCMWSTPYDIIFNLITSKNKHNTCGMGIWSTIKRYQETHTFTLDEFLLYPIQILHYIKMYYEDKISIPNEWKDIWNSKNLLLHFIEDCKFVVMNTKLVNNLSELNYKDLIFENGQGLLLCDTGKDEEDKTPSQTGIHNALELLKGLSVDITAHYVTRPYLTRHGIGYLENEMLMKDISNSINEDSTNHFNNNQGEFRYGQLDLNNLYQRIIKDVKNINYELELTHCDEMDRISEFNKIFKTINVYDSPII